MTDQERREKARRIAEAYRRRVPGNPITNDPIEVVVNRVYDYLCLMEAMAEVEAADDDRCRHNFVMLGAIDYNAKPHPEHKCENCDMTYAEVLAELAKK